MGDLRSSHSESGVLTLVLDRPGKRNALSTAMVDALSGAVTAADKDPSVRIVCLRGSGRDFCAGADLAEFAASAEAGDERARADAERLGSVFIAIRRLTKPVVAVVHGRALAGGAGLATACDLVLAREDAELGYPEIRLGLVPAMVMALLRRKVGEGRAFDLVASGRRIGAAEAAAWGLVTRVLPRDGFDEAVLDYLEDLASRPAGAMALAKGLLYDIEGASFEDAIARGIHVNVRARSSEEGREGVRRFLERRPR